MSGTLFVPDMDSTCAISVPESAHTRRKAPFSRTRHRVADAPRAVQQHRTSRSRFVGRLVYLLLEGRGVLPARQPTSAILKSLLALGAW
eukprot:2618131-Rhodomonas_salina.1